MGLWPFSKAKTVGYVAPYSSAAPPPALLQPNKTANGIGPVAPRSYYHPPVLQEKPLSKGRSFRSVFLTLGIVVCFLGILLPTTCDETVLPTFATLAVHQKMIAAYVLGLLTMGIVAYN